MEDWQRWDYLEDEILVRKRRKICITCNHFRYSTTSSCVTILTCPFHQKLIPQGDHLVKGCRYWRENSRIFAPEAAWASGKLFFKESIQHSLWLVFTNLASIDLQICWYQWLSHSLKRIENARFNNFRKNSLLAICFYISLNFLRPTIFDKLNKMLWIWLTYEKVNKCHTSTIPAALLPANYRLWLNLTTG